MNLHTERTLLRAHQSQLNGELLEARQSYQLALQQLDPQEEVTILIRANLALVEQGVGDDAAAQRLALEAAPQLGDLSWPPLRGRLCTQLAWLLGHSAEDSARALALSLLEQALDEVRPRWRLMVLHTRIELLQRLSRSEEAELDLRRAFQINPAYPPLQSGFEALGLIDPSPTPTPKTTEVTEEDGLEPLAW